jgi:two-component system CheB/CheR fusion protein
MHECTARVGRSLEVQIFATDIDSEAIDAARVGAFPIGIANDVSPKRLARFFTLEGDGYRVKKELRDMLVFAPQNLITDPPFTKLDILSCRNLLIYLDATLQKRLFPIFHYSLKPGGILFLGSSESPGVNQDGLFAAVDKKWKIFRRQEVEAGTLGTDILVRPPDPSGAGFFFCFRPAFSFGAFFPGFGGGGGGRGRLRTSNRLPSACC